MQISKVLPREKYLKNGTDSMSNEDLCATLIGSGVRGRSFTRLAGKVAAIIVSGDTRNREDQYRRLLKINGIGEAKAIQIMAAIELGRRIFEKESTRVTLKSTQEGYNLAKEICLYKQEHLLALFLNARYEYIDKKIVAIGSLNSLNIPPRDIIIPALEKNAAYVFLAHNHPSGDTTPSDEDIDTTKRITTACEIVGIQMLDHIVVSERGWSVIPSVV